MSDLPQFTPDGLLLDTPLLGQMRFRPDLARIEEMNRPRYEPSPEEIAAAAAEIRKGWCKATEKTRRQGFDPERKVEVAEVKLPSDIITTNVSIDGVKF